MPITCPKCGTSNVDGATFCASCGAPLTAAPPMGTPPPYSYASPTPGPKANYTFAGAISSAIALVRNPIGFMMTNRDTPATRNQILINYVAVLAAITFIGTLIGDLILYGVVLGYFGVAGLAVGGAFVGAIISYIFYVAAVFIVGVVIKSLASNFRSQPNDINALKLSSYVFTPFFLASIAYIIPYVGGFIAFLGLLYGLYILYKGLPIMVSTPQDQVLIFTIVIVVVAIVIFAIIGVIIGLVVAGIIGAALGFGYFL
jgi:hypothetical protein